MTDPTELHQRHWEDQDPTTAHINKQAERIAQIERERDEARDRWLVEALYAIAEVSRGNPEGDPGDVALDEAYQAVCALQKNPSERPEANGKSLPTNERTRLTYAGHKLDQALGEFIDFSDFETIHDQDGEKWVNMPASHWEALFSDARDARAAWSAVGQAEADGEAPREWPLDTDRRWWVGEQDGNVFDADADWSGVAVTIEVKSESEAKAVAGYFCGDDQ